MDTLNEKQYEEYIVHMVRNGHTQSSLAMFHAAASHFSLQFGGINVGESNRIKRLIKGGSKFNSTKTRTLRPFYKTDVTALIEKAKESENFTEWRTAASVALAFSNFLRVSEIVSLRMSDLTWSDTSILFKVRQAKRRPNGFESVIARSTSFCNFLELFWTKFKVTTKSNFPCFPLQVGTKFKQLGSGTLQKDLRGMLYDLSLIHI